MLTRMYIDKFDREVIIEDDHPLAVAQLAKGGKAEPVNAPPPSTSTVDYSKFTKAELLDACEKAGRETTDAMTKKDLIALLKE